MTRIASLITFVLLLGALLAGCGDDGDSGDKSGNATPEPTAQADSTPEPDSSNGGGSDDPGNGNEPETTKLTKAQHERALAVSRRIALCVRNAGVFVATDSNAPKSRTLKLGKGVVLRVEWKNNGADIYTGGTRKNTRATKRALDKAPVVYKRKILVLYDKKPDSEQEAQVEECANRDVP